MRPSSASLVGPRRKCGGSHSPFLGSRATRHCELCVSVAASSTPQPKKQNKLDGHCHSCNEPEKDRGIVARRPQAIGKIRCHARDRSTERPRPLFGRTKGPEDQPNARDGNFRQRQDQSDQHEAYGVYQPAPLSLAARRCALADVRRLSRRRYSGVNIATGGPRSVGLKTSFTFWPMRSLSKSQSTRLVIIVTPSSSVT